MTWQDVPPVREYADGVKWVEVRCKRCGLVHDVIDDERVDEIDSGVCYWCASGESEDAYEIEAHINDFQR